ncbi:MAG: hypothetical protein H0V43_02575 [Gemmatimonadales bacterium]|nr:hypothetical protein [Gemmatimonadales bacterium]MBA3554344.1 hypothetical protein [Gemmatimonadales bacterium]
MTTRDIFGRILGVLDVAGIPFMLTGSFASSYHGAPRATQDIDLVIAPERSQLITLHQLLPETEYYMDEAAALEAFECEGQFNVVDLATGWKIDLIMRRSRPFSRTEFNRRAVAELEGLQVPIATAEDILLAKLEWAKMGESARQIDDAAGILRIRADNLDMAYIQRWVGELELEPQWESAQRRAGS